MYIFMCRLGYAYCNKKITQSMLLTEFSKDYVRVKSIIHNV